MVYKFWQCIYNERVIFRFPFSSPKKSPSTKLLLMGYLAYRMSTHEAVATVAIRAHLQVIKVPTIRPIDHEVRVRVEWIASTPLNLHQNDGGLLVQHPQILGGNLAGTVIEVGPLVQNLAIGDPVSENLRNGCDNIEQN
jgi:D-arabinose 1-dehydrogenase-like Zn-dependent alcohol dehydrogenase